MTRRTHAFGGGFTHGVPSSFEGPNPCAGRIYTALDGVDTESRHS
jgi:hypothetical protein